MDKRFKINDNRPISTFSKNSFMGETVNGNFTNLKNLITSITSLIEVLNKSSSNFISELDILLDNSEFINFSILFKLFSLIFYLLISPSRLIFF